MVFIVEFSINGALCAYLGFSIAPVFNKKLRLLMPEDIHHIMRII